MLPSGSTSGFKNVVIKSLEMDDKNTWECFIHVTPPLFNYY